MSQIKITPALLSDLRQKAEWAGGGYWQIDLTCVVYEQRDGRADTFVVSCEDAEASVMTHIAAASPAVVLSLVAEIDRLRDRLDELECPNCGNQPKFCMCDEQPEASNADQA
jgi:hypothetical protein